MRVVVDGLRWKVQRATCCSIRSWQASWPSSNRDGGKRRMTLFGFLFSKEGLAIVSSFGSIAVSLALLKHCLGYQVHERKGRKGKARKGPRESCRVAFSSGNLSPPRLSPSRKCRSSLRRKHSTSSAFPSRRSHCPIRFVAYRGTTQSLCERIRLLLRPRRLLLLLVSLCCLLQRPRLRRRASREWSRGMRRWGCESGTRSVWMAWKRSIRRGRKKWSMRGRLRCIVSDPRMEMMKLK